MPESLGLTAAIGGLLLAIVIVYGIFRNWQRTSSDVRRTEEATKDLYARTDRQDKASDPDTAKF